VRSAGGRRNAQNSCQADIRTAIMSLFSPDEVDGSGSEDSLSRPSTPLLLVQGLADATMEDEHRSRALEEMMFGENEVQELTEIGSDIDKSAKDPAPQQVEPQYSMLSIANAKQTESQHHDVDIE
jgi:hypothetical protein